MPAFSIALPTILSNLSHMLSDQILEWADTNELPKSFRDVYLVVDKKVKQSHRFVLTRDAVMTIQNISTSEPKRFLDALSICRLPYPIMWVEFVFKDRHDWMMEAAKRGMNIEDRADASPPARLGLLLEQQDTEGRVISVLPCWSHPAHKTVSICHMGLLIDTRHPDIKLTDEMTKKLKEHYPIPNIGKDRSLKWMHSETGLVEGLNLEARLSEFIPDFILPVWELLFNTVSKTEVAHLMDMARYDLKAEWRFVLSLLTVLNSRNIIEISPETDLTKINKARLKAKKPLLMSHREIRLNMSRFRKKYPNLTNRSLDDLQAHFVRGHLKMRKSGLFWWSPFVRGYTGEAPLTTTKVTTS